MVTDSSKSLNHFWRNTPLFWSFKRIWQSFCVFEKQRLPHSKAPSQASGVLQMQASRGFKHFT